MFPHVKLSQADEEKEALKQQFQLLTSAHSCLQEEVCDFSLVIQSPMFSLHDTMYVHLCIYSFLQKSTLQKELSSLRHGHEIVQQLESQVYYTVYVYICTYVHTACTYIGAIVCCTVCIFCIRLQS